MPNHLHIRKHFNTLGQAFEIRSSRHADERNPELQRKHFNSNRSGAAIDVSTPHQTIEVTLQRHFLDKVLS